MAETTVTLDPTGRAGEPGAPGAAPTDNGTTIVIPAGDTRAPQSTPDPLQRELDDLRAQNARLRQQVNGSTAEALRQKQDREALENRLARLESTLTTTAPTTPQTPKLDLKSRFQRWAQGDDSALEEVESAWASVAQTPPASVVKPEDLERTVRTQITQVTQQGQRAAQVMRDHPELTQHDDALYQDVYDNYELYEAQLGLTQMFPDDPSFVAPLNAPKGVGPQKSVDLRRIDSMLWRLKAQRAQQQGVAQGRTEEHTAQTVGQVQANPGSQRSGSTRPVEALELLSPKMRAQIDGLLASNSFPSGYPRTREGIAKWYYDGCSEDEKHTLIAQYQSRARGVA